MNTEKTGKSIHIFVSGMVQGVGYRFFVRKQAQALKLTGYVRNLKDGRVEVLAEGDEESLNRLIGNLKVGPSFSSVKDLQISWEDKQRRFTDFTIKF